MRVKPKTENSSLPAVTAAYLSTLEVEEEFNTDKRGNYEALLASVRHSGVVNPIHVRRKDGVLDKLFVVDGHSRYAAACEAKVEMVPIIDHGIIDDIEAKTIAYRQNCLRRKPTKKEILNYCKFFHKAGLSKSEIGEKLALSKSSVSEYLLILSAQPAVRKAAGKKTSEGGIGYKASLKVAKLPKEQQKEIAPRIAGKSEKQAAVILESAAPRIITDPAQVPATTQNMGVLMPGETLSKEYRLVSDWRERCQKMELEVQKRLRQTPSNLKLQGMELAIGVLRGKLTVEQAFVNWQKV